jgi:hypothetical protein
MSKKTLTKTNQPEGGEMKNSRSLTDRIAQYKAAGWRIDADKIARKYGVSRGMAPDGEYDRYLPLPEGTIVQLSDHDKLVQQALDANQQIAAGALTISGIGHIPTAWIDYMGLERNNIMYKRAQQAAREELEKKYNCKLYARSGTRFIRV